MERELEIVQGDLSKILVVEDTAQHISDAREFFADKDLDVLYARDLTEAKELIRETKEGWTLAPGYYVDSSDKTKMHVGEAGIFQHIPSVDGVISDIFMPTLTGDRRFGEIVPAGVYIAMISKELGIPCVLNTAGWHHGGQYEWINQFAGENKIPLVDSPRFEGGGSVLEGETKKWGEAYQELQAAHMFMNM